MKKLLYGRQLIKHELAQNLKDYQRTEDLEALLEMANQEVGILIMGKGAQCQRCGNQTDFHPLPSQGLYCLNCLQMGRITNQDFLYSLPKQSFEKRNQRLLTWQGTLSSEQSRASQALLTHLKDPRPHLLVAVTGAGKTEMIFETIEQVLQGGGRVAVASPRVDVCRELAPRLQEAFASVPLLLMHGDAAEPYNHHQLIVSTTHQLLRFKQAFDLLIIDEVDAFPYIDDASLHYAVRKAVHPEGKLIYLTATPNDELQKQIQAEKLIVTTLPARYHGHGLAEPVFQWIGNWRAQILDRKVNSHLYRQICQFLTIEGAKLLFIPDIRLAKHLHEWLKSRNPHFSIECVHSKDPQRKEKVQQLRDGKLEGLISTTILERGVTFTNCHVFIIGAENRLFTSSSLVQMSGRVGRRPNFPIGVLIYGHEGISRNMLQARKKIKTMNRLARKRGLIQ